MYTLLRSDTFDRWLRKLHDKTAQARILARLKNAGEGHFGDVQPVVNAYRKCGSILAQDTVCITR